MQPGSRILVVASDPRSAAELVETLGALSGVASCLAHADPSAPPDLGRCDAVVCVLTDETTVRQLTQALHEVDEYQRPGLLCLVADEPDFSLVESLEPDDFMRMPWHDAELRSRARLTLRRRHDQRSLVHRVDRAKVTQELTQVLASSLEFHEIVFTLVRRLAETMDVDRVSLVLVDEHAPDVGHVIAASDDYQIANLELDLAKYPEIQRALDTRQPLSIDDVENHPVLDNVRRDVPKELSALFLFPIVWRNSTLGVLFLRTEAKRTLRSNELNFCAAIANATGVALRNARALQQLKSDHHRHVRQAADEAEQRGQALRAYQDLFASAPDGIAVFAPEAALQFANPKAYSTLGYRPDELGHRTLYDLLTPESSQKIREIWSSLHTQQRTGELDLFAVHKAGHEVTLSAAFSVLDDSSVLVQFRDVTEERTTAAELRKTKEFLESLINASVDAIVAADLDGTLILFNTGAEHIYGYSADEVIGTMHVSALYPEGVAREVMRKIRCPEFGGEGRLQSMHSCAVNRSGQLIPISLSAAMIYENGRPVATVGIFTDLREKILAEERLAQAQKKLEVSEKQALLAELAGTAAHELNQPLTSVMGYGELLSRKLPQGSAERNAAQVIVRETERMADLVRKIGRITRYETKSYVGDQRILDLEKASDEDR